MTGDLRVRARQHLAAVNAGRPTIQRSQGVRYVQQEVAVDAMLSWASPEMRGPGIAITIDHVRLYNWLRSGGFGTFCAAFMTGESLVFCYFNLMCGLSDDRLTWWVGNAASRIGTWPFAEGTPTEIRQRWLYDRLGRAIGMVLRAHEPEIRRWLQEDADPLLLGEWGGPVESE